MHKPTKALFMPFMQIPTGHHQVADALIHALQKCNRDIHCDKVDILSYSYGKMEKIVSSMYLTWIKLLPGIYSWIYQQAAYQKNEHAKHHHFYELLFFHFFRRLVHEKNPRIIFCTHALPSYLATVLKRKKQLDAIIVNVYTDYFVNRIWGLDEADYHFVPNTEVKEYLLRQGVGKKQIFVTGIPVHEVFATSKAVFPRQRPISVLVTGGSLGVGAMQHVLASSKNEHMIHYHVLCGKNTRLYEQLLLQSKRNVTPYPYINCRHKMNDLYDMVDVVVTKPGGVTISESLHKKKPIFLYPPLPGQEQINVSRLEQQGLAMRADMRQLEQQIINYFADDALHEAYEWNLANYHRQLDKQPVYDIVDKILQTSV